LETQEKNINNTFFKGTYQEVWRKLIPPGLSEVECSFVEETASLQPGDKVLDLMCGYGRHTLELCRRGYHLTAIDSAAGYIAEIETARLKDNLAVEVYAAGALEAPLHHMYKAIICMGNSFAFFNRDEALSLLRKLSLHLLPDGVLIINTWMIAEIAIRHFQERVWLQVDDYKYLLDYQYNLHPSRIDSEHTIIAPDNKVEKIQGVDYIFTLQEMEAMFMEAGLHLSDIFSTPKKRTFKMGDSRAYLVIEKRNKIQA
jgi:SAM-dependent methyltransferase